MAARTGVLLVNTGSPNSPAVGDVRRYLREFLSDPRILDMPAFGRWMLLNLVILPFRPRRSAAAYREIWTDAGSPLLVHGETLAAGVRDALGDGYDLRLAMRYGAPSIRSSLASLAESGVERVVVVPLFPQYAEATSGSVLAVCRAEAERLGLTLDERPAFFDAPGFVAAFAEAGAEMLEGRDDAAVLFSFHGLPERQIHKADPGGRCLASDDCCTPLTDANRHCYRAQCFETARLIAGALQLPAERWSVSFQSRMGRIPWIGPHTEERLVELAQSGTRRLVVFAPAFVADCLETLEELGLRAADSFRAAGGEELTLVPSLNSRPAWIRAVAELVRSAT